TIAPLLMSLSPSPRWLKILRASCGIQPQQERAQFLTGNSIGHGHRDRRLNRTMRFGRAAKGVSDARVVPQCCICDVRQEAPIVGERPLWGTRYYDRLWRT